MESQSLSIFLVFARAKLKSGIRKWCFCFGGGSFKPLISGNKVGYVEVAGTVYSE